MDIKFAQCVEDISSSDANLVFYNKNKSKNRFDMGEIKKWSIIISIIF